MLETVAQVFQSPVALTIASEDQFPPNMTVQSTEVLSVALIDGHKAELERQLVLAFAVLGEAMLCTQAIENNVCQILNRHPECLGCQHPILRVEIAQSRAVVSHCPLELLLGRMLVECLQEVHERNGRELADLRRWTPWE